MPHSDRPSRAEDAIAQLKRSREHTAEASPEKRAKTESESPRASANPAPTETTTTSIAAETNSTTPTAPEGTATNDNDDTRTPEKTPGHSPATKTRIPSELATSTTNGGESTVNNRSVLEEVAHFERRRLGSVVYMPHKLIARGHELDFNCVSQVKISHAFLTENAAVEKREVWGTDVYTDDTDLVAALHHLGYLPVETAPEKHSDLLVEVSLLPGLVKYTGSHRNGMLSRSWSKTHDGLSYMVLGKPRPMTRGWATAGKETSYERFQSSQESRNWDPQNIVYI